MSVEGQEFALDLGASFTEDAPRPPVPGEEGELVPLEPRPAGQGFYCGKGDALKAAEAPGATPRRPDLDLGYEPEGSASPTPPYLRWAGSLHSLLDDQDGIHLFRTFLKQEGCADLLDFWFACSGFRKLEPCESNEEKRLKLAKAIYKKYVLDGQGIVSRQIKPATKSFIKDCVLKQLIDPAVFDQAQTEIQSTIEENSYPLFLKSDIYLEYTRTGGESPKAYGDQSPGSGAGKGLPGYLPTLNEDEEWKCDQEAEEGGGPLGLAVGAAPRDSLPSGRLTQKLLLETATQRAASCPSPSATAATTASRRYSEGREFRHGPWREPVHPYYVNTGYALAPATSANDSEQHSMSSDADTMSLTDSSVDGIPPYRLRKQHRREMQESAKANGRVPLPHIPRTYRMPKDIHVEPQKFAAELINRLEEVLRDREAEAKLEERLKRVRAEEEGEEADLPSGPSLGSHKVPPAQLLPHFAPRYAEMTLRDAHEENPETILDEHVQRVMKTPGCQSPKPHSPDSGPVAPGKLHGLTGGLVSLGHSKHHAAKTGLKLEGAGLYHHKHVYHHVVHHHGSIKPKELPPPLGEAESPGQRGPGPFGWGLEATHGSVPKPRLYGENMCLAPGPLDPMAYSGKAGLLSKRNIKKGEVGKGDGGGGAGYEVPGSPEDVERNQKIMQWIIEGEKEISRHKKTSHSSSSAKKQLGHDLPRPASVERPVALHPWVSAQLRNVVQPSHPFIQDPTMPPNPAPNPLTQLEEARRRLEEEEKRTGKLPGKQRGKSQKKPGGSTTSAQPCENIVVAYYFCGEPIPYRTLVKGRVVSLGQFKELLTKKGNYRYYFKKVSDEFDCGVVFEEVREDEAVLPIFEEKIIGKVEKID
ncbi:axin-1 isoform X2 [Sceloporus undulatus]|uniref:axin-1 isoform X2 n=1 Tax=Sceloporus undulatus TaxID=8520 RepID=UPI001C4C55D4|nr:axin-1 isoform X2 [Sceloporus undulatus]